MTAQQASTKVEAGHLKRNAYLYIRQSTLRQVLENTESTERQYALKQRAIALGWSADQIVTVDCDLGQSGSSAADREGFQKLVADVGLGHAGIVMGLEVSRLARNSTDWHRLLEICALTHTLILDEDGIYDPAHFNDRLLLGLKGTMSEAELHLLRARLVGGKLNKARRGELEVPLPVGLSYDPAGRVALDPDKQVQQTMRTFFETFTRTGSATATVKLFREQGLPFPRRVRHGANKGEIIWGPLLHSRSLRTLHSPRYAGAFCYGRTAKQGTGRGRHALPQEEWTVLIRDAHPGYISWDQFERNQKTLADNAAAHGVDRRRSPAREGTALLQGMVICGLCGDRMTVRYHYRHGSQLPQYVCQKDGIERALSICQSIPGAAIDEQVGELVLQHVTPSSLEVTLAIQQELSTRVEEADALRRRQVERAQYEVDLARRRYMRVDPENRLVADSLEAEWNARLRKLKEVQEYYESQKNAECGAFDDDYRKRILALAQDLPALWRAPKTPDRERKRMLRLLIEDVTLLKKQQVTIQVRFRGGATQVLRLPRPKSASQLRKIESAVVADIDRLLEEHTDGEIAEILRRQGVQTYEGTVPHRIWVGRVRRTYKLKSRFERLRERGLLTNEEIAAALDVSVPTIKVWRGNGWLKASAYSDRPDYLYEPPDKDSPKKSAWKTGRYARVDAHGVNEVQCEA